MNASTCGGQGTAGTGGKPRNDERLRGDGSGLEQEEFGVSDGRRKGATVRGDWGNRGGRGGRVGQKTERLDAYGQSTKKKFLLGLRI